MALGRVFLIDDIDYCGPGFGVLTGCTVFEVLCRVLAWFLRGVR